MEQTMLSGMNEIANYVRRSSKTVLEWIRELDFPASKIGGIWESDPDLINAWRKQQIVNRSKPVKRQNIEIAGKNKKSAVKKKKR